MAAPSSSNVSTSSGSVPAIRIRPPTFTEGKLDGSNYLLWKFKITTILDSYELLDTVLDIDAEPVASYDLKEPTKIIPPNPQFVKEWRRRNADAICAIVTSVQDSVLTLIQHTSKASEAWNILKNQYETRNQTRIQNLENQLAAERLNEDEAAESFVSRMKNLRDQMAAVGIAKSSEDLARRCIRVLPPKYDGLVTALNTQVRTPPLTFEEFTAMLQEEEMRLKSRENQLDSAFSAKVKSSQDDKKKGKKKKFSGSCYYCNKKGHAVRDCRKRIQDEKSGTLKPNWRNKESANVAETEPHLFTVTEESCSAAHVDQKNTWVLDSGASRHMTSKKELYDSLMPLHEPLNVVVGNDERCPVEGTGTISIMSKNGGSKKLADVLLVPQITRNLLSVAAITDNDLEVRFKKTEVVILDKDESIVGRGIRKNNLYEISSFTAVVDAKTSQLWHERFGHISYHVLKEMQRKEMVLDLPSIHEIEEPCEACMLGKQQRKSFPKESQNRSKAPLELVHADLCGKMTTMALGGSSYFMLLVDDHSRKMWVYFLRDKADALEKFKVWHKLVMNENTTKLKKLRTDRGGEFCSTEFNNYCNKSGIQRQLTAPYTPQQNGVVERRNRTVVEMARCMLKGAGLPDAFWAEAVNTAVYVLNRCSTRALNNKTPDEAYYGTKPSVSHLRKFGCECFVHIPSERRKKLDDKSKKCIFLGYSEESKAYRLYDVEDKKIVTSRDVVFNERPHSVEDRGHATSSSTDEVIHQVPNQQPISNEEVSDDEETTDQPAAPIRKPQPKWVQQLFDERNHEVNDDDPRPDGLRRSKRIEEQNRSGQQLVNMALMSLIIETVKEPVTVEEAMSDPNWKAAMQSEYDSIMKNDTWEIVDKPAKRKVIGTKWVWKVKYKADGSLDKYKARLVAQGFSQVEGFDVDETFAPTAKMTTIRLVIAAAAHYGWVVHQMDVKSAFLNGQLEEEVYVAQPPGFQVPNAEDKVCKLKKALYGLKQAPRAWYKRIDSFFLEHGFYRSKSEANLYVLSEEAKRVLIVLYVDDLVITGDHEENIRKTQEWLSQEFEMTDLGLLHYCLGIEVWQKPHNIFISQQRYVRELLIAFGMSECKSVVTPMEGNTKLSVDDPSEQVDGKLYRRLVGSLIFLCNTRPDISYAVGVLSRFSNKPRENHWQAGMRILKYLRGTLEYGITYKTGDLLYGYCDSDWAGDIDSRKSVTGYGFMFGGSIISWASKKQPTVALSSTEAEYKAACVASSEAVWLRRILSDIGIPMKEATTLHCDNQSCIALTKNSVFHARTKHIEIQYHYVRDLIQEGIVYMEYCPTEDNCADIFTKALGSSHLNKHLLNLGIGPTSHYT